MEFAGFCAVRWCDSSQYLDQQLLLRDSATFTFPSAPCCIIVKLICTAFTNMQGQFQPLFCSSSSLTSQSSSFGNFSFKRCTASMSFSSTSLSKLVQTIALTVCPSPLLYSTYPFTFKFLNNFAFVVSWYLYPGSAL